MEEEGLVKIHIELPNHWAIGGESIWATPLGGDLYKVENVPFYAYGINFHDIVIATSNKGSSIPEIREIKEKSGHRTFRVFFKNKLNKENQEEILNSLDNLKISYERANEIYVALDMQPEGNYQLVFDKLSEFVEKEILGFETCESRINGSFDDIPEDE